MSASRWCVCVHAMAEALLGLGGNVGDVRATIDAAVDRLCDGPDVTLVSHPVGGQSAVAGCSAAASSVSQSHTSPLSFL